MRGACCADVTSVQDEPMMCCGNIFWRYVARQLALNAKRRSASLGNKSQPMAHAEDMRVDRHRGFAPDDSLHDVCCLSPNTRKARELLQRVGDFALKLFDKHASHSDKVPRLVVWVGNAADKGEYLLRSSCSHSLRRRKGIKKGWRDEVDTLVGTLRREDDGNKQRERIVVVELRFGNGHSLPEIVYDGFVKLFAFHL